MEHQMCAMGRTDRTTVDMNIIEIRDAFRLDTPGDAWDLVLDTNWHHYTPEGSTTWVVEVPKDVLPNGN